MDHDLERKIVTRTLDVLAQTCSFADLLDCKQPLMEVLIPAIAFTCGEFADELDPFVRTTVGLPSIIGYIANIILVRLKFVLVDKNCISNSSVKNYAYASSEFRPIRIARTESDEVSRMFDDFDTSDIGDV